ncbi:hypothetical protein ENSA5_09950 [Enhygromyxa salina]|uniref:Uncharacterized protein n=1 Tax=Enhygromyxa salina TaxID=215803 RepID=A0A2S9YGP7_9BACT|nr:hypothetical protein [Enhygromyxa salina]PRQ04211.1 hypothetical protein ENSA5_09950 [Enhygromyxa salina]
MTAPPFKLWRTVVAAAVALPMTLGIVACKTGNAAQKLADSTAPTLEGSVGKCKPGAEASKSLVVEWPMGERAALESRVKQGLVAVRYRNCEMELITNCTVSGAYSYTSVTPKSENIKITNADELYAKIPIGAVKLEGKLERDGQLNVDMVLVGRHEASRYYFQTSDLSGRCDGATHVVTGLSVGAFVFYSGAGADIGISGGVKGTGVETGAGSTASKEILNRDGDAAACSAPSTVAEGETGDLAIAGPPAGCAAALQVEVVPIDRPQMTTTTSTSAVGKMTDTNGVAGVDLATETLDKRIKVMTFTALSGYAIAAGGVVLAYIGLAQNKKYSAESTDVGAAGSADRSKYIAGYTTSQAMLYGGIGGFVLGAGIGLWATVRGNKLRNERSTRLAGLDVAPLPGGGFSLGAAWSF